MDPVRNLVPRSTTTLIDGDLLHIPAMTAMDEIPADRVQDSDHGRWAMLVAAMQPRWLVGDVTLISNGHSTKWRIVYGTAVAFISGGVVEVRFPDGQTQRVGPEEVLCMPDGVLHRIDLVTPQAVSTWCHLELALPNAVDLTLLLQPPLVFRGPAALEICHIVRDLAGLRKVQGFQDVLTRQVLLWNLAQQLLHDRASPASSRLDHINRLRPAMDQMKANLHRELPVAMLAQRIDLSVSQFYACFKAALGCSPITWMRRQRMAVAQRLLLITSEPIQRIAARCGYSDPYHFSRLFRRYTGRSPSHWRKQTF